LATIQDSTIQELNINNIRGFPTIRLIKDRKVIDETLGGMSEERLMEFLKNAHKQCVIISPKHAKKAKKIKKDKTTKKAKKIKKDKNTKKSKNTKKANKSKKKGNKKAIAKTFKTRTSYSQTYRKKKRFRPKLKIINESKTMSGGADIDYGRRSGRAAGPSRTQQQRTRQGNGAAGSSRTQQQPTQQINTQTSILPATPFVYADLVAVRPSRSLLSRFISLFSGSSTIPTASRAN